MDTTRNKPSSHHHHPVIPALALSLGLNSRIFHLVHVLLVFRVETHHRMVVYHHVLKTQSTMHAVLLVYLKLCSLFLSCQSLVLSGGEATSFPYRIIPINKKRKNDVNRILNKIVLNRNLKTTVIITSDKIYQ